MTGNGHDPEHVDLRAILETTKPARVLSVPVDAIREDSLTPYELVAVGRALEMTPTELTREIKADGWARIELAQAFAWAILRRVEPALTWDEAKTYRLELAGSTDPPPVAVAPKRSRRRGMAGSSTSTG